MKIDANTVLLSGKFGTLRFKFTAERGGKEYKPAIQKSTTKVANWPNSGIQDLAGFVLE